MTYFSVHNLSLTTENGPLLTNLDFQLEKPSFVAILGHNGVGKTTFLKALTGQALFEGLICFKGIKHLSADSFISQNPIAFLEQQHQLHFPFPVLDIVLMGRYKHTNFFHNYSQEDKTIALQALKEVGLIDFEQRDFLNLSGGEQQLVLLAQMISQEANFMLLDEPTQSLDIRNKKRIMDVIKALTEQQKTIFITTHDIDFLEGMDGYLINFSCKKPTLVPISSQSIVEHKQFLMK